MRTVHWAGFATVRGSYDSRLWEYATWRSPDSRQRAKQPIQDVHEARHVL
ncbi:MAG TPA: hypothetical protein VE734_03265 [Terriglobales bacterium]|nr:hypothetical protein [Terriglobales bacterium]